MADAQWPADSMFEPFTIFEETYKSVASHDIKAAILLPPNLETGPNPVIVNIHGGFFSFAHSLFAPFLYPWSLDLAKQHGAIIVSADYRLLPSANGVPDPLEDLEDFWQWTRMRLPEILTRRAPGHFLDYPHTLLLGGSAGGYCVAQLALSHPGDIAVLAMAYPCVNPKDDLFVNGPTSSEPTVFRFALEEMPSRADALAWVEEARKTVVPRAGIDKPDFFPLERVQAGAKLPRKVYMIHGDDDSVVNIRMSNEMADLIERMLPETTLKYDVARGQDHGFDLTTSLWEESFAGAALDFITKAWLY